MHNKENLYLYINEYIYIIDLCMYIHLCVRIYTYIYTHHTHIYYVNTQFYFGCDLSIWQPYYKDIIYPTGGRRISHLNYLIYNKWIFKYIVIKYDKTFHLNS